MFGCRLTCNSVKCSQSESCLFESRMGHYSLIHEVSDIDTPLNYLLSLGNFLLDSSNSTWTGNRPYCLVYWWVLINFDCCPARVAKPWKRKANLKLSLCQFGIVSDPWKQLVDISLQLFQGFPQRFRELRFPWALTLQVAISRQHPAIPCPPSFITGTKEGVRGKVKETVKIMIHKFQNKQIAYDWQVNLKKKLPNYQKKYSEDHQCCGYSQSNSPASEIWPTKKEALAWLVW